MDEQLAGDIRTALQVAGQQQTFEQLPPSHQREYLEWINEAKKPETRQKRIAQMCQMLAKPQK